MLTLTLTRARARARALTLTLTLTLTLALTLQVSKPEAAFQRLQAAHEVLVDERQRALYDRDL